MLKHLATAALLAAALTGGAHAATVILLPEAGSMGPATVIMDPKASIKDPVLICSSISQLSSGGCSLTTWARLRR
nr:hypothetical protein [uncultured Sphingosinicella sp.]